MGIGRAEVARRGGRGARRTRSCSKNGEVSGGPARTLALGARALAAHRARAGAPLAPGVAARRADATAAGTTQSDVMVDFVRLEGDDACAASLRAQVWRVGNGDDPTEDKRGPHPASSQQHSSRRVDRFALLARVCDSRKILQLSIRVQTFKKKLACDRIASHNSTSAGSVHPSSGSHARPSHVCFVERISEPRWRRRSGTSATSRAPAT